MGTRVRGQQSVPASRLRPHAIERAIGRRLKMSWVNGKSDRHQGIDVGHDLCSHVRIVSAMSRLSPDHDPTSIADQSTDEQAAWAVDHRMRASAFAPFIVEVAI